MSNQQKVKFVGDIFCIPSFWGGHGKVSPQTCFIHEGMMCQKCCFGDQSSFRLPQLTNC
jgi:hypothetical protein